LAAEEEEDMVKQQKKVQEAQEEQQDAEDLTELFGQKPQKPPTTDVERDVLLVKVKGRSSKERKLVPVYNKGNKLVGYKAVDIDNPFNEIFDEDMTLANLDSDELNITREHCNLSNFAQALSESTNVSLTDSQKFYKNQMKSFLISSRAKKGFAAWLVKTEKSISEGTLARIQQQVEEKKRKRWGLF